jgi:VWFA-related protein
MNPEGRYNQIMRASFSRRIVCVSAGVLVSACALGAVSTRVEAQKPVGETPAAKPVSSAVQPPAAHTPAANPASLAAQPPVAQTPAAKPASPAAQTPATSSPQRDIFRTRVDLVTSDVIARDGKGQFIADLKKDEFEVYEDGVKQNLISFTLTHGGRIYNVAAPPPPPPQEGIILPPPRPTNDAAGRIFLIFVDDLHLDFKNTPRIKQLFKQISKELVHEGDMFGVVSTGPSSLSIDLTYDRKRLDEAIDKISGAGLKPQDILETPQGQQGNSEIRYRAHVAFSTAYDIMKRLEDVHNRRKAFIYVSNGYDFNPFEKSYQKTQQDRMGIPQNNSSNSGDGTDNSNDNNDNSNPDYNPFGRQGTEFAQADLVAELSELTREANRANASIYTIDPRGLIGMVDIEDDKIDMVEWNNYVRTSQDSLRVLAEQTGGLAIINQNDFLKALKRIDAETSDYYVLGYYSSNPDPTKKRRNIEIRSTRSGLDLRYRTSYTLKPLPRTSTK